MNYLKFFMDKAGISPSELARLADEHRQTIKKQMDKPSLPQDWAEKLAPLLGTTSRHLIFGPDQGGMPVTAVRLRGETAAGRWFEVDDFSIDDADMVPVVPGKFSDKEQFAYKVVGNSMELARIYAGDYVICVPYWAYRSTITDGDIAVVERARGQLTERTCKQLILRNGGFELRARSNDPQFAIPLLVPHLNQPEADDGTHIEIIGLVIGSFRPI